MIFVDTGAWFARTVPSDRNHLVIRQWMRQNREGLITTDYIVDETLTLLRHRGERRRALILGEEFFRGRLAHVYYLTENDIRNAWLIFQQYADKEWSFTDCTSKLIIERLGIAFALSFDHHFRQFGSVTVAP